MKSFLKYSVFSLVLTVGILESTKAQGSWSGILSDSAGRLIGWPLLYTEALYSRWEGEDTNRIDDYVGIRHPIGRPDLEGAAWSVEPTLDSAGQVQSGPFHYQLQSWFRSFAQLNGLLADQFPRYEASFRLRIDSAGGSDTICTISVSVSNAFQPKTTIAFKILTADSFRQAGWFQNFYLPYSFARWKNTPSARQEMDWVGRVSFNIDWMRKRKLYIDYTEVYDELGRRFMVDPFEKEIASVRIKSTVLQLARRGIWLDPADLTCEYPFAGAKWSDSYLPVRYVDSLMRSVGRPIVTEQKASRRPANPPAWFSRIWPYFDSR